MRYTIIIILLTIFNQNSQANTKTNDFVVGKFGLHYNKAGEIIKPDEYYFFQAMENTEDGYQESALKNFRKAASYGNTFGTYYTGLLYLQDDDQIKGHAWLTMANTKGFVFKDKISDLLTKLDHQMSHGELDEAKKFHNALKEVYGVEASLKRRLKWSRNFKITGTNISGNLPNFTKVITDLSPGYRGRIALNNTSRTNAFIDVQSMKKQFNSFVYEYKNDYRLIEGEVQIGDFELINDNEQ